MKLDDIAGLAAAVAATLATAAWAASAQQPVIYGYCVSQPSMTHYVTPLYALKPEAFGIWGEAQSLLASAEARVVANYHQSDFVGQFIAAGKLRADGRPGDNYCFAANSADAMRHHYAAYKVSNARNAIDKNHYLAWRPKGAVVVRVEEWAN